MAEPRPADAPPLPAELPILPLRQAVVLPLTTAPLAVTRPKSIEAIQRALATNRLLLTLLQTTDAEEPTADELKRVGTVVIIRQLARAPEGLRILVEGLTRARAEFIHVEPTMYRALVKPLPEKAPPSVEIEAYVRRLQELIERALSLSTGLSPDVRAIILSLDDPLRICYVLASMLDMKPEDKQLLLEEDKVEVKLNAVAHALAREIEVLELKGKIESKTQEELTQQQRQYVLRQQLKAIQEELGEQTEAQELRRRLEEAKLPEAVASAAAREIDRLERMTPASPEYQMIRTYLDWIFEIPWTVLTEDRLDPVEARRVLDEDHYDLDKVKERIVEYLAVRKLKGDMKGPILCFVGPPGVGKTSLGQSIARAMNRKFVRISLGGVRDEAEIRGHRRTYIGSMPGRIVQGLKQAGSLNPVFMLDEIDKVSPGGFQGDPAAALLEVLDPAQNSTFRDHYLEIQLDLSRVLFITTANQLGTVHPALQDRMEILHLVGYTEEEKMHIARRYLLPRQLNENGLPEGHLILTDAALERIIREYTREAGVRNLERQIGTVARKVAARLAAAPPAPDARPEPVTVDAADLPAYLGPAKFKPELEFRTSRPGVATGVAWTETGGDILFVEAAVLPEGRGQVLLTGQLGQVMQESARAAVSHLRERATELGLDPKFLAKADLHVHVPAGAIPKDGPSAGITMATAVVSALKGIPVKSDVAMTGEITLSGLVLPVGGIREKALAARRHGIKTLVLPEPNLVDLEELPPEVRTAMTFVPVRTLDDVLRVALRSPDGPPAAPREPAAEKPSAERAGEPEDAETPEEVA
jgi:ATP-dependent Lon protease